MSLPNWLDSGQLLKVLLDLTRKQGLLCFYFFRVTKDRRFKEGLEHYKAGAVRRINIDDVTSLEEIRDSGSTDDRDAEACHRNCNPGVIAKEEQRIVQ